MKKLLTRTLILATCLPTLAHADETAVKKMLEGKSGKIERLVKSSISGLWEVTSDGQVFYADDAGRFLVFGNIIDSKSGKNLTAERQFSMLPLDAAVKQVRGSGKNILVTFEDPNCGYCKKLAKEMQSIKDITIYTFLYPVLGDDSVEKSRAIWCAADRGKTWNEWMVSGKAAPAAPEKCNMAGLEKSIETGQKLRINGTPALFFANGDRANGYIPTADIERRMAAPGS